MLGISLGYYKHGPWLLSKENRRKIEPNETPSCLIPCLLVVFTWQLEILVTTLVLSTDLSLEIPAEFQYRKSKSRDPQVCQLQGKSFITHFTPRPDYTGMIWQPFHMSFWHLEFFGGKGWSGGHNMASVGRERVHCCNFLRSLYQCLAYFFNFFIFFLHCLAFFTRDRYKTCWYTWSKLNWSFDFVFCLKNVEFIASNPLHGTDTYSFSFLKRSTNNNIIVSYKLFTKKTILLCYPCDYSCSMRTDFNVCGNQYTVQHFVYITHLKFWNNFWLKIIEYYTCTWVN